MNYKQRLNKYKKELRGWGLSLPSPKVPRAFSTNVSNETTIQPKNLCHYSGLRSTADYME